MPKKRVFLGVPPAPLTTPLQCPRCQSTSTQFSQYNNKDVEQPRYLCNACNRCWTVGGRVRDIPVRSGYVKKRAPPSSPSPSQSPTSSSSASLRISCSQTPLPPTPRPAPDLTVAPVPTVAPPPWVVSVTDYEEWMFKP